MKIVINVCYGGFGLSEEALRFLGAESEKERAAINMEFKDNRTDPALIGCVEALGGNANGRFAELRIVEIPDGIEYSIEDFGGHEWIAEKHRTWDENGLKYSTERK